MKGVEMKKIEIYCCTYIANLESFPIIKVTYMYVTAMLADFENF